MCVCDRERECVREIERERERNREREREREREGTKLHLLILYVKPFEAYKNFAFGNPSA